MDTWGRLSEDNSNKFRSNVSVSSSLLLFHDLQRTALFIASAWTLTAVLQMEQPAPKPHSVEDQRRLRTGAWRPCPASDLLGNCGNSVPSGSLNFVICT